MHKIKTRIHWLSLAVFTQIISSICSYNDSFLGLSRPTQKKLFLHRWCQTWQAHATPHALGKRKNNCCKNIILWSNIQSMPNFFDIFTEAQRYMFRCLNNIMFTEKRVSGTMNFLKSLYES